MAEPVLEPLLAELRSVVDQADPIPPFVLEGAKAAFTWRTIDTELAELAADSLATTAGVRAAEAARLLTFRAAGVEIEVEVAETGPTRRLTGQLVPAGSATVTVRWTGGALETAADEIGRFAVEGVPAGAVSMSIVRPGTTHPVVTSWVSI